MPNKVKKNTLLNRILWRIQCKKQLKKMPFWRLNEFYHNLLVEKRRSRFPDWQVGLSLKLAINEIDKRRDD